MTKKKNVKEVNEVKKAKKPAAARDKNGHFAKRDDKVGDRDTVNNPDRQLDEIARWFTEEKVFTMSDMAGFADAMNAGIHNISEAAKDKIRMLEKHSGILVKRAFWRGFLVSSVAIAVTSFVTSCIVWSICR